MKTKRFFTSVAAFVFVTSLMPAVFVSTSYATTGINIISQTHHVWGAVADQSYNITDSAPVSGFCSAYVGQDAGYITQNSHANDFIVDTRSSGGGYEAYLVNSDAFAQIDYTFQPQTGSLEIAFSGYVGIHSNQNLLTFELKDLDTSTTLDYRFWTWDHDSGWVNGILPDYGSYDVNPDHTYSMTIIARSHVCDVTSGYAHLEAVVTPEPATILILGFGALILRKRRV